MADAQTSRILSKAELQRLAVRLRHRGMGPAGGDSSASQADMSLASAVIPELLHRLGEDALPHGIVLGDGGDSPPAPQTPEALDDLAERLIGHANGIRNPAASKTMGEDMRLAARVIAMWQIGIAEAIATTVDDTTRGRLQKLVKEA